MMYSCILYRGAYINEYTGECVNINGCRTRASARARVRSSCRVAIVIAATPSRRRAATATQSDRYLIFVFGYARGTVSSHGFGNLMMETMDDDDLAFARGKISI